MPELPEVETVVRDLKRSIVGRVVADVVFLHAGLLKNGSIKDFDNKIVGKSVAGIRRRGKLIIVEFGSDLFLLIHLKMTGQLVLNQETALSSTRAIITFKKGDKLYYNDFRKFGFWEIVDAGGLRVMLEERFRFGPEPLSKDFSTTYFISRLAKTRRVIKQVLLDQTVVAGIGNIYADESLFRARVNPGKIASSVTPAEAKRLHEAIGEVLREAIKRKGSSSRNYVRVAGTEGSFQKFHRVYRKTGQPCPVCKTPIERIVLGGRGTHFCPRCQK